MRKNLLRISTALVTLALVLSVAWGLTLADEPQGAAPMYMPPSTDGPTRVAAPEVNRFIVQLEDAPLATYTGGVKGYAPTAIQATGANRLDVNASASRAYIGYLQGKQEAFKAELAKALSSASVSTYVDESGMAHDLAYQVTFNGVVVTLPKASPQALRTLAKMDGVKQVFRDYEHKPDMYASLTLIDAPTMWSQLGGQDVSGEGMIVASIDTGVYAPNPFFDPTGYQYPPGYPVGDRRYTTKKVIGARAYFRPWDPPTAGDEGAWPGPNGSSHGTHTIGTTAGNADTVADVAGLEKTISGVAPKAQILSYRIGYPTASEFSGSAFSAEIVMAYEDAVVDGADSINYSFGGYTGVMPWADAVAVARDATWDAGVFVSHSAGNSGPGSSTTWDSSPKVMEVAASSTTGTIATGLIDVTSPEPVPEELQGMPFGDCLFCPPVPVGTIFGPYSYTDVGTVTTESTNTLCDGEEITGDLTGQIAMISRGGCYFSDKIWNAQQAGAIAAIVYNNAGDDLTNMSQGTHENDEFTIPGVFIGQTNGEGMVQFGVDNPGAEAQFDFVARQMGNVPDVIAGFSSRGPAFARFLEPDVTAPGVNILSGGYATGATGVDRHAGFGQASGTSMAAPHVAGAAALVKQMHPDWTPTQIRSALMTTSVIEVWLDADQTVPASVLDMGAGRIDLGKAGDPGLTFDYPSVSFGGVTATATATAIVQATEVAGISATYDLSTTADEGITASTDLRGISVEPGGTASFELTVEAAEDTEPGDYGGFVWLDDGVHLNHIPFWVRVEAPPTAASVLLIDNDMSDLLGFPDYADFYADTLDNLGVAYDYYNADLHYANPQTLPSAAELAAYDVIIYWSGDNYYPDGTFTVATPLTELDMQLLTDWQFNGGRLLVTGQDLASAWDWSDVGGFLYAGNLGAGYLQDSIFDPSYAGLLPPVPAVVGLPGSPLSGMALDVSGSAPIFDEEENLIGWEDGAGNQYYVDEVELAPFGDTEAPDSVFPILAAIGGYPIQEGYVASARADSPTLERPQARYDYRSLYLSFGFEGINNDTGYTTREELMGELLNWLNDEVTVTLGSAGGMVNDLITLSADAASSVGAAAVEYRWDFGDSSDVAVSTTPSVVHVYASGGTYTVRVEVTDEYGHKAVDEATVTIIGSRIFLPLVFKSYTYVAPASFTILHTNDFHGYLETDYRGRGGSAYMAGKLNDIRAEVGEDNVFLLDAGDVYLGAAPISQLLLGESAIDIYNMLGYDVAAYGNHEFDKGQDVLQTRTTQSDFPWISANIVLEGTEWDHPTWTEPYVILSKGGVDLGILGLTTDETPLVTLKGTTDGLVFKDLTETVLHYYDEVLAQADALIVLAHMGTDDSGEFKGLETVAQELIDAGKPVDLMIAGHQHQALSAPVMVGDTAIVGAGFYGRYLGRVDLSFDYDTQSVTVEGYELITINNELTPDPEVEAQVAYWAEQVAPIIEQVVGYSNVSLVRDYNAESNMGNLVTDGMLWKADQYDDGEVNGSVDIAFTNPGGLRANIEIPEGTELPYEVTWGDTFTVLPFGNTLFLMDLTGAEVQELLDQAAKLYKGILQTSGAQWYWYNDCDCDAPTNWGAYGATVDGEPLDPEATYRVVTNNFLAGGQDGWVTFAEGTNRWDTYYDMQWGVNEYIEWYNDNVGPIDHQVEGRIVKLDKLISILHTNDIHGTFPTTSYYGTPEGVTYLATHIAAERAKNPNTLLIDAGDTFQGNAFAQYFRNATPNPIAGAMNMLDYDAFVIGNHEYNFGPTTFATMLGQLDCQILGSANLDDDGAYGFINDNVEDYITLNVDGVDVAIFGLTNPEVPIYELPSNIAGLTFYPAITTAQALVPQIRADEDPDLLIALTHIGYDVYKGSYDKDKAMAEQVPGIDVIVGGHSHTKLDPAVMITSDVNPNGTLVAQTKAYAEYLGKINIGFVSDGNGGYDVVLREGYLLPAGDTTTDAEMVAYLEPFVAELAAYTSTEVGQTTAPIEGGDEAYIQETTSANLQADSAVYALTANGIDVDFHLSGAMTDRSIAAGATAENPVTLTVDDMYTLMKYENSLVVMEMNGPQLKAVLERAYRNYYYYKYVDGYGGYSHYTTCMLDINAGGVITYTDTYPAEPDGNNVVGLAFNGTVVDFADADTYYNVSTVNYLAAGSCNFNNDGVTLWPLDQMTADTQYYVRDSVIDYIMAMGTISPAVEGRLVFLTD